MQTPTVTARELTDLAAECHYSDEGGIDADGHDLGSVDSLIEYKNALEDRAHREGDVLDRIAAIMAERSWSVGLLEDIAAILADVRDEPSSAEARAALGGRYYHH